MTTLFWVKINMETSPELKQLTDIALLIREQCWDIITENKKLSLAGPWSTLVGGLAKVVQSSFALLDFEADGQLFLTSQELGRHYFYAGASLAELQNEISILRSNILNLVAANVQDLLSYVTVSHRLNVAIDRMAAVAIEAYHKAHASELLELGQKDRVTKLLRPQAFLNILEYELLRAKRFRHSVTLLLLTVDSFSRLIQSAKNKGEKVLVELAKVIVNSVRAVDIPARFSENQFALLLPQTDASAAMVVAQRLRKACRQINPLVTVSIGLASYPEHAKNKADLIKKSHLGLILALKEGNSVRIYSKSAASS